MSVITKPIRGAVIGYGGDFNMGKAHANQMLRVGFDFAAACDLNPVRMEQAALDFPGIRTYTRVEDMLAQKDLDLITVITPHNTHAELAERVLLSGKHCILEKPMCLRAEEADRLVRLANKHELMLTVYHNRRWDGWYLTLKELIRQDKIGDIFHVEMYSGGYSEPRNWWRDDKEISGGAFYDWGAHYLDYLFGIVPGKIRSVRGFIHNRVWHQKTNEDQIDSIIEFEHGTVAQIQISSIARAGKANFRILGTKGAIEVRGSEMTLYSDVEGENQPQPVEVQKSEWHCYYDNIANHLLQGAELFVITEEARRIIAVIEAIEISAKERMEKIVPFEDEMFAGTVI